MIHQILDSHESSHFHRVARLQAASLLHVCIEAADRPSDDTIVGDGVRLAGMSSTRRPQKPRSRRSAPARAAFIVKDVRIGIARDAAALIYIWADIERSLALGADVVYFSPLLDADRPSVGPVAARRHPE